MIIDTETKALRKYNESACLIISHLDDGPVSFNELKTRLLDESGVSSVSPEHVAEFLEYMERAGLLVASEKAE